MVLGSVVEKFPGQVRQGWNVRQPQADTQSVIAVGCLLHASAKLGDHFSGENRVEQFSAKCLRGLQLWRVDAAHGTPHLPDAAKKIGKLDIREGKLKLRGGLTGGCIQ